MGRRTSRWRPGVSHRLPFMKGFEARKPLYQIDARPVKTWNEQPFSA